MSEGVENFLTARLPIGGVVAYSILSPSRVLVTDCLTKSLYPTSTEQMLNRIVQTGRSLLPCGEQAAHYCWTFEGHRVYVAARSNGICLALLVENTQYAQVVRIKETLQEFLDLQEI